MRILDQWGINDIPYKNAIITIDDGHVLAYLPAATGKNLQILLAIYSDTEVAKVATKKLRIAYQRHENAFDSAVGALTEYFQFPPEEHL